jgi:hypothetical protein
VSFRKEVHDFGLVCEGILSPAIMSEPLTKEESALIEYYCLQLLEKVAAPLKEEDQHP